jgi:tryptophan halogenase
MSPGEPIRSVLVVGGGIIALSAAAALKHRLPRLAVGLLATPPSPAAVAEKVTATLPSILEFHRDMGLGGGDAVLRAGCCFRLGTEFDGWAEGRPGFVHAYGEYGRPFGTTSFHHHWVQRARLGDAEPFDAFSAASAMARAGRFAPPQDEPGSPLSGFEFGLRLDLPRYRDMLQAYVGHLGVVARPGRIAEVRLDSERGFIAALSLDEGSEATADLFVDCTGPEAQLRSALDEGFESWTRWLPCDRVLLASGVPEADPSPLDRTTAIAAGWRWRSEGVSSTLHGLAYAAAAVDEGIAEQVLRQAGGTGGVERVALIQGRRPQPWLRNCVAIGDSAVSVEPLEWTGLHLAHSAVDRVVAMLPDRDFSRIELWDYNRQCVAEADRVRDFLALHYLVARRSEPFWREAAAAEPPESLAHTLALFRERGRLPFYEEETFGRDSWLAVLFGLGMIPRRVDPLVDGADSRETELALAQTRRSIAALIPNLPTQAEFLRNLTRRSTS